MQVRALRVLAPHALDVRGAVLGGAVGGSDCSALEPVAVEAEDAAERVEGLLEGYVAARLLLVGGARVAVYDDLEDLAVLAEVGGAGYAGLGGGVGGEVDAVH